MKIPFVIKQIKNFETNEPRQIRNIQTGEISCSYIAMRDWKVTAQNKYKNYFCICF